MSKLLLSEFDIRKLKNNNFVLISKFKVYQLYYRV